MHAADGGADEERYPLKLTEIDLWAKGEGVCGGVKRHRGVWSERDGKTKTFETRRK